MADDDEDIGGDGGDTGWSDSPWRQALAQLRPPQSDDEPYIAAELRPHDQWGKPDETLTRARAYPAGRLVPGPFMPQGGDVAPLLHRTLNGFARDGTPSIGDLARAAGKHNARWWIGYAKGLHIAMGLADADFKHSLQRLQLDQQAQSEEYGIAFELYKDNPTELTQRLQQIAFKHNDHDMQEALQRGDLAQAYRINQARDHHYGNLVKYNEQTERAAAAEERRRDAEERRQERERKRQEAEEKQRRAEEERRRWLGGADGTPAPPPATDGVPAAPPAAGDEDTGTDLTGADRTPTAPAPYYTPPPRPGAPAAPTPAPVTTGISRAERAARDIIMDRKPHIPKDETIAGAVEDRVGELQRQLDQIASNPGIRPEQVVPMVRAIHPELANDLQTYMAGNLTVPGGRTGASGHFARIIALGDKARPGTTPEVIQTRRATERDFTSGNDGRNLSSIGTAFRHLDGLEKELRQADREGLFSGVGGAMSSMFGTSRYAPDLLAGGTQRRERIGQLDSRVTTAISEYERALIGGKPTQTGRQHAETMADWRNRDIRVVLGAVAAMKEQLAARLQEQKDRFVAGTGGRAEQMLQLFDRGLGREDPTASAGLHDLDRGVTSPAAPAGAGDNSDVGTIKEGRGGIRYRKKNAGPDADRSNWEEVR